MEFFTKECTELVCDNVGIATAFVYALKNVVRRPLNFKIQQESPFSFIPKITSAKQINLQHLACQTSVECRVASVHVLYK